MRKSFWRKNASKDINHYNKSDLNDISSINNIRCTTSVIIFQPFILRKCDRNKGLPEDVLGALEETINLKWTSDHKIIFHIADYPHHGKRKRFKKLNTEYLYVDT